jgi:hypothetical protein
MANRIDNFQIEDLTITDAKISSSAGIALTKLAEPVIQADGGQSFTANQSMNNNRLTGVATPVDSQDAANAAYVDAKLDAVDRKESVRMSTTQDLASESFGTTGVTYANGTAGVGATLTQDDATDGAFGGLDGVTTGLATGQRIIVQDQTSAPQNGIYEITALGNGTDTAWVLTRTTDADSPVELHSGTITTVREGSTRGGITYQVISQVVTIGTSDVDWTQASGLGQVVPGTGLTKDGNTLDVESANAGIAANADNIELKVDATAGTIVVGGGGIQIADGGSGQLLIGQGASDTSFQTVGGDLTATAGGSFTIVSGAVDNAKINAAAAISLSKLASGSSAQIIVGDGSGVPTYVTMSGDATISNTGVLSLAATVLKEADVVVQETPSGSINGTDGTDGNASFSLANTPIAGKEILHVNGVRQIRTVNYNISGASITFISGSIPRTGNSLVADYLK